MTTQITYRKTRLGEWVAFGPADQITAGQVITITRKDGTTSHREVASTGKTFIVGGTPMVYGYLKDGEAMSVSFEEHEARVKAEVRAEHAAIKAAETAAAEEESEAPAVNPAGPFKSSVRNTRRFPAADARPTTRCKACGHYLTSYDVEVSAVHGYHADCL